jgi:hypothetical protein
MRSQFSTVVVIMFLSATPVLAWNNTGHMVAAYIAYVNLSPNTKAQIDKILQHHPDYKRWIEGQKKDKNARYLTAFLIASTWADAIKGDSRFYDENGSLPSTPLLNGFPDMRRHREWHFIDVPFSPDGTPEPPPRLPNLASKIQDFERALNSKSSETAQAYVLVWLIHLIGDIHQPLHSVNWFTKNKPTGDRQGIDVLVDDEAGNLHKFWDDLIGRTVDRQDIIQLATTLLNEPKPAGLDDLNVRDWLQENVRIARNVIYTFNYESMGTRPLTLSQSYMSRSKSVARQRISLAGYRLAGTLNEIFGHSR